MRYRELFENNYTDKVVHNVIDLLTPLASSGVDSISIDELIKQLNYSSTGLLVDREMIMSILNPDRYKIIKSVEGDTVYLNGAEKVLRKVSKDQKEIESDRISDAAEKEAMDQFKK